MGSEIQRTDSKSSSSRSSSAATATAATTNGHHQMTSNCGTGNGSPTLANDGIAELTIVIDEHDVQGGARQVLHSIRPTWRDENIKFKVSESRI